MPKVKVGNQLLDARPDRLDLRDLEYRAPLRSLPHEYPDPALLTRYFPRYAADKMVLDQGQEGACTGFGLAAVINYLRWIRIAQAAASTGARSTKKAGTAPAKVSPRMLYHLARFYDEWPGEDYEGSSCRGAMKGWHRHGVCEEPLWPYRDRKGKMIFVEPAKGWDQNATLCPLGVYYRIDKRSVVDMQAAIYEVGAIYVSGNVHGGWFPEKWRLKNGIACIETPKKGARTGGHSFCLVGYNRHGFVVQNSWGPSWGTHGFAILPFEDWVQNGMDAWATVLGAPIERAKAPHYHVSAALATQASSPATLGATPGGKPLPTVSAEVMPWSQDEAYRHTVVLGNNGALINRNVHRETLAAFDHIAFEEPRKSLGGTRKQIAIYAHGGLNSEEESIKRIQVLAPYFEANGIYPLFLTWKTGVLESLKGIIGDGKDGIEPQGAWKDIWDSVKSAADEARDRAVEAAAEQFAVKAIWTQMKQNAEAAATRTQPVSVAGARPQQAPPTLVLMAKALARLRASVPGAEIHLVGHSAGSILFGHLLNAFAAEPVPVPVASCTLYAPACSVQFAVDHYQRSVEQGVLRKAALHVDLLSDERENEDTVGPYGKSLLYLVSRALETHHKTPILGMQHAWLSTKHSAWSDDPGVRRSLNEWQKFWGAARGPAVLSDAQISNGVEQTASSHGSFDNDIDVVTRTIERISGKAIKHRVERLVY
jgi:hypothetical protein